MVITFPREMPDALLVAGLSFYPEPMAELTPLRSGKQISVDIGPTLRRGRWQSTEMGEETVGAVLAWYETILSYEAFYGYDKRREYPLNYGGGFGGLTVAGQAFSGKCAMVSVAGNAVEVSLAALPAGFVFKAGDYLAFDYGTDSRALHRIMADATADGSGLVTVEARPPIRPGYDADLVTNGAFTTDTAWTKGTGWTIAAGVASAAAATANLSQTPALVTGRFYRVNFTVSGFAGGTVAPNVGGTAGTARSADGTYSEVILAGATTTFALVGAGFTGNIDNLSILSGVHLHRASAKMIVIPGSYSEQAVSPDRTSISFEAIQTL